MGRNAKPINFLVAQGNKHLTKAEIEQRKATEIKLGDCKLKCPDYVRNDIQAYKKWKEIIKIYKDTDIVSSGDVGLLARYCKTFSEYQDLLKCRQAIGEVEDFTPEDDGAIREILETDMGAKAANRLIAKVHYILSVDGMLQIDAAINKKMDMLIKMEDRTFLNPLAKVKNIPKKEKEKEDPLLAKGFGDI